MRLWALWLVGFLVLTVPPLVDAVRKKPDPDTPEKPADEPARRAAPRPDLGRLQQALQTGDDAFLLDFLGTRGLDDAERKHVENLVDQLGSDRFSQRTQASAELEAFGSRALPLLHRAMTDADVERASRARRLYDRLTSGGDVTVLAQAIRRLIQARPEGTIEVLLHYLPDAEADVLAEAIRDGLVSLTPPSQTPEPILVKALRDAHPHRRAAAVLVLGRSPAAQQGTAIRPLLNDPHPEVRLQAALAVLRGRDKAALPILIDLLPWLAPEHAWKVVDILAQVAGAQGPAIALGSEPEQRARCRDAWQTWWRTHGPSLALDDRLSEALGEDASSTMLVVKQSFDRSSTVVRYVDRRLQEEVYSADQTTLVWAQPLGDGGLLLTDYRNGRVVEVGPRGDTVWQANRPWGVYAERLPGGHVFIACRDGLWEVDRDGKTVATIPWPTRAIATARRLPDGRFVVLTDEGICVTLDREGRELTRFATGCSLVLAPGIDVTANGRILIPDVAGNRVVEFSPTGEVLWQHGVEKPTSAQRLPNGDTLTSSTQTGEIHELTRMGRRVAELKVTPAGLVRPLVARRFAR